MADDIIGSAAVEIVPDARNFIRRLRAEIEPGAADLGRDLGNAVGDAMAAALVARLRASLREGLNDRGGAARQGQSTAGAFADAFKAKLQASLRSLPKIELDANATPAQRKVQELRLKLEELSGKKIGVDITDKDALAEVEKIRLELKALTGKKQDISVRVNAGSAIAELAALKAAINEASGAGGASAGGGPGAGGFIAIGALGLLSITGPLVGAAVGGLGAVAGAAGATALAIKGIQTEVKNQSTIGKAFSAEIDGIKKSVSGLESTAAKNAAPGFFGAISQVRAELPTLNPLVGELASKLGSAFSVGTGGLITGLKVATPLLSDAGDYAEKLAQKFADFTASPEFAQFITYSRRELPIVAGELADIAGGAGKLIIALQPLGDLLLNKFGQASQLVGGTATQLQKVANELNNVTKSTPGSNGGKNGLFGTGISLTSGPLDGLKSLRENLPSGLTALSPLNIGSGGNKQAAQAAADQARATAQATAQANFNTLAMQNAARTQHTSVAAYTTATAAIKQQAVQLAATTLQMRLQGDVSGLLQQAEDKLSGKAYSAANAQNTFEQGIVSLIQSVKDGGPAFTGLSSAAITNRASLLQLRDAALAAAGTYGDVTVSGSAAQKKLIELRQTIIDNTGTTGAARAQVAAFIDSILKIPSKASVLVSAETSAASTKLSNLRSQIVGIAGHHYDVYFDAHTNGAIPRGQNQVSLNATGGFITGPGSGTSDSIKARLSNGEFVVRASQTAKHRALLEQLNTPGFATGGLVDLSGGGPYSISQTAAQRKAAAGKSSAASAKALAAAQALAKAQANIQFTVSLDLGKLNSAGTAAQIKSAITKLIIDVHTAAGKSLGSTSLIPVLEQENARLGQLATERVALTNKLKAANTSLANQRAAFNAESGQVAGAVSSVFNITSLDGPTPFGTASPAAFIQNLQAEAAQARNAATQLATLRKLGLNKNLVQQLGESGTSGFAAEQSLSTASKAQIAQINQLYAAVQASSKAAGSQVAASLYQAGIDSAVGYIHGLDSRIGGVNKAAAALAATVVKQVRKSLGINSPSKVLREHGRYTGEGFALGIADRVSMVSHAATGLSNAAVQPAQFGPGRPAPQVHVHPAAEHSERAIGTYAALYLNSLFT